jgi:hypothetical protein
MNKLETKGPGSYKVYVVGGNPIMPEYEVEFPNPDGIKSGKPGDTLVEITQVTLPDGRDATVHIASLTRYAPHNLGQVTEFEKFVTRDVLNEFGAKNESDNQVCDTDPDHCCGNGCSDHEAKT